jgi:tRNA threonylcarbamoyladenosine biosynthesis protein TsaE
MPEYTYHAADEEATRALGAALAEALPDGSVVALIGTLGAGKTRLVQAVAEASGVDRRDVVSPTFVFVHEYKGRRPIYHIDAYRLKDDDEFLELGPDEYFEGDGLTLVEWADRVERCMPIERLDVEIRIDGESARTFAFRSHGSKYDVVIHSLRQMI